MYTSSRDPGTGQMSGTISDKDACQETTLGAYSPVDYMSITSFPRLPEDDAASGENIIRSRKEEDAFLSEQDTDPDLFLKSARLQRLPSSSSELASQDVSPLRETQRDPLAGDCTCRQDGLTIIITACLTFATGVTVALIMQIYFGDPQIFSQGAVSTDVSRCTSLGVEVLKRQGSSVDAAIAAAVCVGIINPHSSGIGGGGVMLVHDIRKNLSKVIDFRETAPSAVTEEMFQLNVEQKPGLLVGVPGVLRGMYEAHQEYGRLSWAEIMTMTADIAREGFNITHDLAEAIYKMKDQNVSENFQDLFFQNGQPLLADMFMQRLDLAAIFDVVGRQGVSAFYNSNLTQEIVSEVRERGGVLQEDDFVNYVVVPEKPLEGYYQGHQILVSPPPHAGAGLILALNILEGFNITSQVPRNSTYHWITETLKMSLAMAGSLGDPQHDPTVAAAVNEMLSKSVADFLRQKINESRAFPPSHYMPVYSVESGPSASQVVVMGSDDFIVSVVSSLNRPFGSGIVTSSGIVLNSQMLDFSWQNKTQTSSSTSRNSIQPGKRPLSFLLPTVVRPGQGLCGTYLALGASSGEAALSGVTQVLLNVLSFHLNLSDSLSLGRLHPQLQPNTVLVDNEFSEEDIDVLKMKGHEVERKEVLSIVEGTRRTNDLIIGVKDPRNQDASAATTGTL
ncbi:glutathione hydrolase 7 [Erpetoichthys calabaricus]|uniref:Glutathione hydrolase n=1 Tax=Erpetoichthys calabaricus TaxID=27687 RepID=A0A8C4SBU7_ERPCA|nr:glutathione hydrolase 7 [Erpetoichthys calabaricus]